MYRKLHQAFTPARQNYFRLALLAVCCVVAASVLYFYPPAHTRAASPNAGTISETSTKVTWTGAFMPATADSTCTGPNGTTCDNFKLTVVPPAPSFGPYLVQIKLQPALTGDWDMTVYGPAGNLVDGSGNSPGQLELVTLINPPAGTYTVAAAPFAPVVGPDANSYAASAEILHQVVTYAQPGADAISYHNFAAPSGLGTSAGEPSIGID